MTTDIEIVPLDRLLADFKDGDEVGWPEAFAWLEANRFGYLDVLTTSIQEVGIQTPIELGSDGRVWDGHHRLFVAQRLGIAEVPVVRHT